MCTILYKGVEYTDEEFINLLKDRNKKLSLIQDIDNAQAGMEAQEGAAQQTPQVGAEVKPEVYVAPEIATKLKDFAEKIREGKISRIQGFKANTPFTLAWDGALEVLATTLDTTANITIAVDKALAYIRNTDWYKGLSTGRRQEFEDSFIDHINKESGLDISRETAEPRLSGIKKALVPQDMIDETNIDKRTFVQQLDRGKQLIENGDILPSVLIQDIIAKPKALQPDEVAALVYHKTKLDNSFDSLYDRLEAAQEDGNTEDQLLLKNQLDAVTKEIDDYHQMALLTAYEQSLAFNLRKMLLDNEYNLQTQIKKYKAVNQGVIPADVEAKFKEYEKQLAEVNKKLRDLEKRKNEEDGKVVVKRIDESLRRPRQKKGKDLIAEGLQELMQSLGGISMAVGDTRPSTVTALSKIGRGLIDEGLATLDNVMEKIKDYLSDKAGGRIKINLDEYTDDVKSAIKEFKGKPEIINGKLVMPKDIIRDYVASGMDDINEIVSAVKRDYGLEATDREVRDAIVDYGKTLNMNQDDISVKVRELKRIGKIISGLEDVIQEKKKPLRSGLQRDKLTDRERRLQKELREAMKDLPVSEEESAAMWKGALDKVKERLRNQIADLQNQIATGQKTPPKKGIEYDAEAKALQEQRDALRDILEKMEGPMEMSDAQRVRMAIASTERWADEYERRIREKDFSPLRQKSKTPITPELEAARKRLASLKDALREMMDVEGVTEQRRLELLKNNMMRSISQYAQRLRDKDFAPRKPKPKPQMDTEALELEALKNKIKDKFDIEMEKARLKNRPLSEKAVDQLLDIINLPKSLLASADLSAPLRQGALLSFSHPILGARAFKEMFKQAFSPKNAEKWLNHVKVNPSFNIIRQSKLYISEPTTRLSAKEEQFMTNIAHKIPIWGSVVRGSERAYVGYLNKLRLDVFLQGVDSLNKSGYNFQNNPDMFKSWADFVNNATGRGSLGALEGSAAVLNTLMFSPRLVASRFNLLNPIKYVNMPKEVRKMALRDVSAFVGVGMAVLAIAAAAGAEVEDDPRSTDFGKIKIGNFRFDIWAGFQQVVRMFAQVISGQRKSSTTGMVRKLSAKDFPFQTRFDVVSQFMRGKLAPIPSLAVDLLEGETSMGEDLRIQDILTEKTIPLYLQDMKEIYDEEGGVSAAASSIPALFGVGTQYYKPGVKKRASTDPILKMFGVKKNKDLQNSPEAKIVYDLYVKTENEDVLPNPPSRRMMVNGVSYELDMKQHNRYTELVDQARLKELKKLVNYSSFKKGNDSVKIQKIKETWEYGRKIGKDNFMKEYKVEQFNKIGQ